MTAALSIKYKIQFNYDNDPKDFTFVDIIAAKYNTTYGYTLSNIKGLIKVVSPSGVTVYINGGYANNVFISPDIDGNTTTWTKDLGSLPLDSNGDVETGTYSFYYKVSVDGGSTVYLSSQNNKEYDLGNYVQPTIDITLTQSCRTSELTSYDATDYAVQVDNSLIDPTITRAHKIVKPEGAGCTIPSVASTDEQTRTIGGGGTAATDIWTGVWQTYLTSTLVYDLATWGSDVWIQIYDEVSGYDYTGVVCSDCMCDIRECLATLYAKWQTAVKVESRNRVDELRVKNLQAVANFMLYDAAERCGEDSSEYCDNLATILVSEDCTCGTSDDDVSARVVAWGNSTGTGAAPATPSAWLNGSADPSAGLGSNGDYYLQTGTGVSGVPGDVWYKSGGSWVILMNILGADGAASSETYNQLISVDPTDDAMPSAGTEKTLKDYAVTELDVNGDVIEAEAYFELSILAAGTKTVRMYFAGALLGTYISTSTVTTATKYLKARVTICRIDGTNQLITCEFFRSGVPGSVSGPAITAGTAVDSVSNDLTATGESSPGRAGSITCKQLTVEFKPIYVAP